MKKYIIYYSTLFLLAYLFIPASIFSQSQDSLLWKAYNEKSYTLLEKFFENWRMEKTPITDEEYQNLSGTEKDVYDIYYEFYDPKNLSDLTYDLNVKGFYKTVKYFIISPKIYYSVLVTDNYDSILKTRWPSVYKDTSYHFKLFKFRSNDNIFQSHMENHLFVYFSIRDSIIDFRPRIKDKSTGIVYMSPYYDSLFSAFINKDIIPPINYSHSDSLLSLKIDFLKPYIFLNKGFFLGWEILTCPRADNIDIAKDRLLAEIWHTHPSGVNTAIMSKIKGKWTFVTDDMILIY